MSDFHFANSGMPRRTILICGYGLVGVIGLIGLIFMFNGGKRKAQIAEMNAQTTRADSLLAGTNGEPGLNADAFYTGDTPQLAQAALQTSLQELAESHNTAIEVIRAEQIEQIDDVVRLNLTVSGVVPEADLGSFLSGLATLEPLVVIEALTLRRARGTRSNAERRVAFQAQLYGVSQP